MRTEEAQDDDAVAMYVIMGHNLDNHDEKTSSIGSRVSAAALTVRRQRYA